MFFFQLFLIFLLTPFCQANESEAELKIVQHLKATEVKIDLMLPGIFSLELIRELKSFKEKGILIRIISDRTFETSAENLLFDASEYFPIKLIDSKFSIPHNLMIIDQKLVVMGGAYYPRHKHLVDHTYQIQNRKQVDSIYDNFQKIWQNIKFEDSHKRMLRFQHYIDLNSSEVTSSTHEQDPSQFVASKNGKKYYRSTSKSARRILEKNRIYFQSEEEAQESGRSRARNF
ncbi:hypothetical protein MJH12_17450 [bacterium]|nr:hypothetical protein [bacterium]